MCSVGPTSQGGASTPTGREPFLHKLTRVGSYGCLAPARTVRISLRAAQIAISCFWIAAAIISGNRSGVQANDGIPRLASTAALC